MPVMRRFILNESDDLKTLHMSCGTETLFFMLRSAKCPMYIYSVFTIRRVMTNKRYHTPFHARKCFKLLEIINMHNFNKV